MISQLQFSNSNPYIHLLPLARCLRLPLESCLEDLLIACCSSELNAGPSTWKKQTRVAEAWDLGLRFRA